MKLHNFLIESFSATDDSGGKWGFVAESYKASSSKLNGRKPLDFDER